MSAKHIASTEFQRQLRAVMDRVRNHKETVIVCAHGRPQVAILPVDEYEGLLKARRELAFMRLAKVTAEPATGGA